MVCASVGWVSTHEMASAMAAGFSGCMARPLSLPSSSRIPPIRVPMTGVLAIIASIREVPKASMREASTNADSEPKSCSGFFINPKNRKRLDKPSSDANCLAVCSKGPPTPQCRKTMSSLLLHSIAAARMSVKGSLSALNTPAVPINFFPRKLCRSIN